MRAYLPEHAKELLVRACISMVDYARRKCRNRSTNDGQERRCNEFNIPLVLFQVLVASFTWIKLVTTTRWHRQHGLYQWLYQASQVAITVDLSKCGEKSGARGIAPEKVGIIIFQNIHFNASHSMHSAESVPVRSISWSINMAINFIRDVRLSKRLNSTDIIMSTSAGGHISQIINASTIYLTCHPRKNHN